MTFIELSYSLPLNFRHIRPIILQINKQWRRQSSLAAVKERFAKRSPTSVSELSSGLKVATENTGVPTATVGVWIEAGPRFESNETNGVANLLEHLVFKVSEHSFA